ncbi:methyltransferase domain-containing protein [Xenorhabdus griffiniae]|uniref:class I SAM-dependent DNA methyltransferase n=2 Tax=Xenorhabdus griffiniae TaxID=351672 RepID=UPI0030CC2FBD|nr:methyltransferase domain-containing protein [Xenorhabdus griffiniae]
MLNSEKTTRMKKGPGFIETFDRIAPTYEEKYGDKLHLAHEECLSILKQMDWLSKPRSILDIGCGTGALLEHLHIRWPQANCIGIDPAQGMIDEAFKRRPFAKFMVGMAEELALPSGSIDLIVCSMSFGHWYDKSAGLHEIRRILHANGLFCLIENAPPGWGIKSLINWIMGSLGSYIPEAEIVRLAEAAGLQRIYSTTTARNIIVSVFQLPNGGRSYHDQ